MKNIDLSILEEIQRYKICFVCYKHWNDKIFHRWMFPSFSSKMEKIQEDKENLNKLVNQYNKNLNQISKNNKNGLFKQEIEYSLAKNTLLLESFDIEANKINSKWKLLDKLPNYDFFSKKIYWIKSNEIKIIWPLPKYNSSYQIKIMKNDFKKLISKAESFFDKIEFKIWNYPNFAVNKFTIKIPEKEEYNLQEIITLFFHEMTHFIRFDNMQKNIWFIYQFSDKNELEEWLALYNEYFYWNQIIDYWDYYPYYHKVYNVLMKKWTIEEKFNEMYKILSCKWFSKEKTEKYFQRFYRFTPLWWEKFIFKEAIYYNAYQNVNKLLNEWINLDYLMSMKWWFNSINYFLEWKKLNNVNYKKYFETMVKEIKKVFLIKS